jgi:hypothetical protein
MDLVGASLAVHDLVDAIAGAPRDRVNADAPARRGLEALGVEGLGHLVDPGGLLGPVGEADNHLISLRLA